MPEELTARQLEVLNFIRKALEEHGLPPTRSEIAEALGPILFARGLMLVGLDIIGVSLTEINVTSPTCFQEITDQMGCDVAALFIDAIEQALAA